MQFEGLFDVPPAARSTRSWNVQLPLGQRPWQIGLLVGPSGCGKSTIAKTFWPNELAKSYAWPADAAIVDAFPAAMPARDVAGLLSSVGFSSPPSWLRPFGHLSNGEQFRATLARALAEAAGGLVVIDEFTSVVDRTVAQIGSAAVAKTIRQRGGQLIAVTCHFDVIDWLGPDWVYEPAKDLFSWRELRRRPAIELEIRRVGRDWWRLFRPHHYLSGALHRAATCWVGFVRGQPAVFTAVVSFPHPKAPSWREHRTVCLPDFQGVGLGNAFAEYIASLYLATGKRYTSTTSAPAMIQHRARSADWDMLRKPGKAPSPHRGAGARGQAATGRLTAGFRYVGFARPEAAREFGLTCRRH